MSRKLKWRSDFDKEVVIENFTKRGWTKADKDDDDWNFYWATVWTTRNLFNPKSGTLTITVRDQTQRNANNQSFPEPLRTGTERPHG